MEDSLKKVIFHDNSNNEVYPVSDSSVIKYNESNIETQIDNLNSVSNYIPIFYVASLNDTNVYKITTGKNLMDMKIVILKETQ